MKLLLVSLLITTVSSKPGLLRVPKVYNAVITSNQNLSPSRAYPVIQPVIHRTAVGYVPPFYYSRVAPHLAGPEVVHLPRTEPAGNTGKSEGRNFSGKSAIEREESSVEGRYDAEGEVANERKNDDPKGRKEKEKDGEDQVPISFYPNYQSLYYDPYFYTYNTFNPHLIPGTYYVDYQPFAPVAPIAPIIPKPAYSEQLLPSYGDAKKDNGRRKETDSNEREKIPDVPPPPVPTSVPKSSR